MYLHLVATLIAVTSTQGLVRVKFSESDYAVNEENSALPVVVKTSGIFYQNLTLQVIPLTFAMYREMFPGLPCNQSVMLALRDGENEADSSDFNTTVLERVIGPSSQSTSNDFNIPLLRDNKLETTEVFLLLLSVTTTESVDISRKCAIGKLQGVIDAAKEVIRLDPFVANVELQEHEGTVVLFNITKIVDTELTIFINIEVRDAINGDGFRIIPSTTLEIPPEITTIPVSMEVIDDLLAEDQQSIGLLLRATVMNTPISQQVDTRVTILDNEVVFLGFEGGNRTLVEGSETEVCMDFKNFTLENFLRSKVYPIITINGTAKAGEDFTALQSVTFRPEGGRDCFTLRTIDNDRVDTQRFFTVSFQSGFEDSLTVIQPSSIRVMLIDNDALPQAPTIQSVKHDENLAISWTAEATPTQPISMFVGNVTVDGQVTEFNVNSSIRIHNLKDFEGDKTIVIVICAVNTNGRTCSVPYKLEPMITPGGLPGTNPAQFPPGLIAGIAVIVAVLLCCCLLLLFLFLCVCWRAGRWKAYRPAKAEGKVVRGKSPDSYYSDGDDYSIESDIQKAPL